MVFSMMVVTSELGTVLVPPATGEEALSSIPAVIPSTLSYPTDEIGQLSAISGAAINVPVLPTERTADIQPALTADGIAVFDLSGTVLYGAGLHGFLRVKREVEVGG
jgi:hypothetical protein